MSFIGDGCAVLFAFWLAYIYLLSPIQGIWMGITGQEIPPPETWAQTISRYWEFFTPWNYGVVALVVSLFIARWKHEFADIVYVIFIVIKFFGRVASIIFALVPAAPQRDLSPRMEAIADSVIIAPPRARGRSPGRAPNLVHAPNPRPAKTWKVNAKVTAPYQETGKRFHATVIEDFNDGTYRIAWKDGDLTDTRKKGEELRRRN